MKNIIISEILDKNNTLMGYKTNGLDKISSKELVIKIPLDRLTAEYILNTIADEIKKGVLIKDNDNNNSILNCVIYFKEIDNEIRIIFPDVKMRYPWDKECDKKYKQQIT